jgi:ribonuclease D
MTPIRDSAELAAFLGQILAGRPLAIDMEFERERTYRAVLQLIQLSTGEAEALVDPLAIDDLSPLWDVIADPAVEILFHAGGQDMEIYYDKAQRVPTNVFDTQVAAALVGLGEQPGYADLVRRVLKHRVKKGERTTDWGNRPLSEAQAEYALDDVRHLHALYDDLNKRLKRMGRTEWLQEELASYSREDSYVKDVRMLWTRVSRHRGLERHGLAILRELAQWREATASRRDIPRNRVIQDDILIDIARRRPEKPDDLKALRRLHPRELERSGVELVEAVRRGVECPQEDWPQLFETHEEDPQLNLTIDLMMVLVKLRAKEAKIGASYMATKRDLNALAYSHAGGSQGRGRLAEGWRNTLIGEELALLLDGRLALAADPESHYLVVQREGGDSAER